MGAVASQISSLTIVFINRLFSRRLKKTSKLTVTGLCEGNSPVTGQFAAQMVSNAENVSIWWRHHEVPLFTTRCRYCYPLVPLCWWWVSSGRVFIECGVKMGDFGYSQTSYISRTESKNLKVSRLALRWSLPNSLKLAMKMWLEQRRQAMLALHFSDQEFYCLLKCVLC